MQYLESYVLSFQNSFRNGLHSSVLGKLYDIITRIT